MNNILMAIKESNTVKSLFLIGIFVFIFGIIWLIGNINNQDYIKIDATITKYEINEEAHFDDDSNFVDATYDLYLKYTVDGKEYTSTLYNTSFKDVGEIITIYYNPNDPSQITQSKSLIIPLILISAGIIAFIGGVICGVKYNKE